MAFQRYARSCDVCCTLLLVIALASLSAAMVSAGSPAPTTIPDQLLDRIRGSNPGWTTQNNHDCTYINVQFINMGGGGIVGFGDCPSHPGAACITCAMGQAFWNYNLVMNNGFQPPVFPKPPLGQPCNPPGGASIGTCGPIGCAANGVFNCQVPANQYGAEP